MVRLQKYANRFLVYWLTLGMLHLTGAIASIIIVSSWCCCAFATFCFRFWYKLNQSFTRENFSKHKITTGIFSASQLLEKTFFRQSSFLEDYKIFYISRRNWKFSFFFKKSQFLSKKPFKELLAFYRNSTANLPPFPNFGKWIIF